MSYSEPSFRARLFTVLSLAALVLAGASCAVTEDEWGEAAEVRVWNRSQFPLLRIYLHYDAGFADAENLLEEPLELDAKVLVTINSGEYLTVVRHQVQDGPELAMTTAEPFNFTAEHYTLMVFDESFRLVEEETLD